MTKHYLIRTGRFGKSEAMRLITEAALDAGKTVATASTDGSLEVRGAATAKDVTPHIPAIAKEDKR